MSDTVSGSYTLSDVTPAPQRQPRVAHRDETTSVRPVRGLSSVVPRRPPYQAPLLQKKTAVAAAADAAMEVEAMEVVVVALALAHESGSLSGQVVLRWHVRVRVVPSWYPLRPRGIKSLPLKPREHTQS